MYTTQNKITVDDLLKARKMLEANKVPQDKIVLLSQSQVEFIMSCLTEYEVLKGKYELLLKELAKEKSNDTK